MIEKAPCMIMKTIWIIEKAPLTIETASWKVENTSSRLGSVT